MKKTVDKKETCEKKNTGNLYMFSDSTGCAAINNYDTYVMQEESAKTKSSGIQPANR